MTVNPATDDAPCGKRYHHGDLRRALLSAADAILERCGPSALSLRGVAREAGVSPAAPYHHFKDKDDLIAAIAREGFVRLNAALDQARLNASPDMTKASVLGLAYVDFAQAHPALYRVMYDSARKDDAFPEHAQQGNAGFLMVKRALEETGGPHIDETDIHLAAIAAWCTAHGLAEMRGFAQFQGLKDRLGGEDAFLRGVFEHVGLFSRPGPARP